jgi:Protein of unknown function (DUF2934)
MSEKPAKTRKTAVTVAASAKSAASRVRTTRRRKVTHDEIAERAYFIHLTDGVGDELENWLRAESELMAA